MLKQRITKTQPAPAGEIKLPENLVHFLLQQKNNANLIALLLFYMTKPEASIKEAAKGLGWGFDRTQETKSELRDLNIMFSERVRDDAKKIKGFRVKFNF